MTKRETIITTATSLFNQKSYTSIGVDRIIAESNVAKMTFYKYFPSKENLIMECLQHRNINIQNSINEQLSLHQDASPLEQIHIIFNWYIEWINSETFNGCLFKKAFIEVSKQYTSIREPFYEYTKWLTNLLHEKLNQLGIENPTPLVHIIISIIDGMIIDGTTDKNLINPEKIWKYIEYLINEEIPQPVS
ncbi:MAG TPA: TetR family transcriptional regulator [Acinetobacter pittii]|nr:TetR family transcriptional regulator [Acinetobacter pittii]